MSEVLAKSIRTELVDRLGANQDEGPLIDFLRNDVVPPQPDPEQLAALINGAEPYLAELQANNPEIDYPQSVDVRRDQDHYYLIDANGKTIQLGIDFSSKVLAQTMLIFQQVLQNPEDIAR